MSLRLVWLNAGIYGSLGLVTVLFLVVFTIPFALLYWSLLLLRRDPAPWFRRLIYLYGRTVLAVAVRPFLRVRYLPLAPTPTGGAVLVFNHRSASDAFLLAALKRAQLVQTVNFWPYRLPLFGFFARHAGYLDSTRLSPDELTSRLETLLQQNVAVAAFPEGTRSGSRQLNQFHSAIFRAAQRCGAPLYPGCIVGNEQLPDRRFRFRCRGGVIRLRLLPPVPPEEVASLTPFVLKQRTRERIKQAITQLEGAVDV